MLFLKTFEGGRGHGFFGKKKLLKGERERGCEAFFFTFCYFFYYLQVFFVTFVYS
jgi:hypothetical protein